MMFFKEMKFTVLLLLVLQPALYAQKAGAEKLPMEKVILTTDRTLYFAGEQIWLRADCLLPGDDSLSRVMYVELLDRKSRPVVQKKLQIMNKISTGAIELPEDILTGNYYIRAYTQYMRNFEKELFYTSELTVINPDLPAKENIQTIVKDTAFLINEEKNRSIEINTSSSVVLPNTLIELELINKGEKNVSVSVVKKGSYKAAQVGVNKYYKTLPGGDSIKKLKWYPEIRSISITGKLLSKENGQPLKNKLVYASVIDSVKQFHVTRTNAEGAFVFALMNLHNNHPVYIGTDEEATVLINPDFAAGLPAADYVNLKMTDAKQALINEMYTNEQITAAYQNETATIKTYLDTLPDPFQTSTETIYLKDYIALPNLTDIFNEIVPYTKVKTKKNRVMILLAEKKNRDFFENTLVLFDNIPFHDHAALLNIHPSKISSIGVIAGPYVFGKEVLNGVITIHSKDGNLAGLELPKDIVVVDYITYTPNVKPDFGKSARFSADNPVFKNTLYWNPCVELKEGKQTLQFASGNDTGEYDIIVRGVNESGEAFTTLKTISVLK